MNKEELEHKIEESSSEDCESDDYQELERADGNFYSSVSQAWDQLNYMCHKSARTLNTFATNLAYNARHSSCPLIQRKPIILSESGDPAFLFGRGYFFEDRELFYQNFQSVIWISYRSEVPEKESDAGWGCMIRVCQMLLAQALKCCSKNLHSSEIIKQFSSSPNASFSFDKICLEGNITRRWTSSTEILCTLKSLIEKQHKFKLSLQMYNCAISIDDVKEQTIDYPLLVSINNRLGQKKLDEKYCDHILALLEHRSSLGMIGGIGGEAIYIIGHHEKQLIVMDPHYVQSQSEGETIHFKTTPRGVCLQTIVPCISFCYLFFSQKQHSEWIADVAESCEMYRPYMAIECDQKISKQIYYQRHPRLDGSDEEFQVLE